MPATVSPAGGIEQGGGVRRGRVRVALSGTYPSGGFDLTEQLAPHGWSRVDRATGYVVPSRRYIAFHYQPSGARHLGGDNPNPGHKPELALAHGGESTVPWPTEAEKRIAAVNFMRPDAQATAHRLTLTDYNGKQLSAGTDVDAVQIDLYLEADVPEAA